jgi:broad specificity phosphatase PhoE
MKTRLIFVRHAEAEGNAFRLFQGWTDGDITDKGHKQALKVAERLKDVPIDILYSSSLKRTLHTAEYISKVKNLPIIRTDKLWEINGGDWEGRRWDELPEKWPEAYHTWENAIGLHRMPNGETMEEFQQRILKEVMYIIHKHKGRTICIVTHGTAIRSLICHFHSCGLEEMQKTPWYDNTAITVMNYEDDAFESILEGDASHLSRELSTVENQDWWEGHMEKHRDKETLDERRETGDGN